MTIKSVTPIALNLPFDVGGPKPLFAGKPRNMEMLLLRVETDSGIVGWGEAFGYAVWPATRTAIEALIAPLAIGRDERDITALMLDLQRKLHLLGRTGPVMYAMSGLDIALWDIAGKAAGKPVAELLGGARRKDFSAYASLVRYTDPALIARNAKAAVERGYRAIKLHEIGVEQVRAAREARWRNRDARERFPRPHLRRPFSNASGIEAGAIRANDPWLQTGRRDRGFA